MKLIFPGIEFLSGKNIDDEGCGAFRKGRVPISVLDVSCFGLVDEWDVCARLFSVPMIIKKTSVI
jgi:hypothetical protein